MVELIVLEKLKVMIDFSLIDWRNLKEIVDIDNRMFIGLYYFSRRTIENDDRYARGLRNTK